MTCIAALIRTSMNVDERMRMRPTMRPVNRAPHCFAETLACVVRVRHAEAFARDSAVFSLTLQYYTTAAGRLRCWRRELAGTGEPEPGIGGEVVDIAGGCC